MGVQVVAMLDITPAEQLNHVAVIGVASITFAQIRRSIPTLDQAVIYP